MHYLIYKEGSDLKAYANASAPDFDKFRAGIEQSNVIHQNGTTFEENVTEDIAEVLPVFIKSMHRQWLGRAVFLSPKPLKTESTTPEEPVAAAKPKKPRKKTTKKTGD